MGNGSASAVAGKSIMHRQMHIFRSVLISRNGAWRLGGSRIPAIKFRKKLIELLYFELYNNT